MRYCNYGYLRACKAKKHDQFIALYNKFMANDEYAAIVNKAKQRGLKRPPRYSLQNGEYIENRYEIHHIVPKCCGGYDYKYNLVLLTRYEHIKCHEILNSMGYAEYAFLKMTGKYEESRFYNSIEHTLFCNKNLIKPSEKVYFINTLEKNIIEFLKENPQYDKHGALKELLSQEQQKQMFNYNMPRGKIDSLDVYTETGLKLYNTLDSIILDDLALLNDILATLKISTNDLCEHITALIANIRTQIGKRIQTVLSDIYEMTSKIDIDEVGLTYLQDRLTELQEYKTVLETLTVIHNSNSSGNILISQCDKCVKVYNNGIIKYNKYVEQKRIQVYMQRELLKAKLLSYFRIFLYIVIPILMGYILLKG